MKKNILRRKQFSASFPGKPYDEALLRKLASTLLGQAEEFLKIEEVKKTKIPDRHLLFRYRNTSLRSQFEKNWKEIQDHYNKESKFDFLNLLERHLLQISRVLISSDELKPVKLFNERMKYNEYGIVYLLAILMQEMTRKYLNTEVYNFKKNNIAEEFLEHFDLEKFLKLHEKQYPEYSDMLSFNYEYMQLFMHPGKRENLLKVKTALFKNSTSMQPKSAYFYFSIIINYCLKNKGYDTEDFYSNELIEIIETMEKRGLIKEPASGRLDQVLFGITIQAYSELAKFDKAEKFAKKYIQHIKSEYRENCLNYSKFVISFAREDYDEALTQLSQLKEDVYIDKHNFRIYKLIMFFEKGHYNEAESLVEALTQFVKKNEKISQELRENN